MNKVFRVIWSEAQGAWVAVSETTKSHSKRSRKHALALALTAGSLIGLSGQALAIGEFAAAGNGSIAIKSGTCGTGTESNGEHSVSIGCGAGINATGPYGGGFADNDTSIGYQAGLNVKGSNNSAIGTNAGETVEGSNNTAFGVSAGKTITGSKNTSLGDNSGFSIKGNGNLSVGSEAGSSVTGDHNVMLGKQATVKGSTVANPISDAVVVGYKASASKSNNVALGSEAKADHENSVALGSLSETRAGESVTKGEISYGTGPDTKTYTYSGFKGTASGVVSVGSAGAERQIINVAPGAITDKSTDAINGSQLYGVAAGLNKRIDESGGWNVVTSDSSTTVSKVAPGAQVDFVSSDKNVAIKHTSDTDVKTSIDFALSDDLKIGSKDGTGGTIAVNGKDGVPGVTIDGKDGSIGLTGPAGANGISPTLTMRPDIKPGDVTNNTNSITRITYKDAAGNDATLATLENDGLRFSGNDNPIDGYVTRLLNKEMQIIGGGQAEDDSGNTIAYSSGNVRTVATQAGGIEIQFAETPNFKGADMGGQQITSVGSGLGGQALTEITGADLNNAVNVGDLQNTTTGLVNTGFNITADNAALTDPSAAKDNVKLGETVAYTGEDGNITTTVKDNQIDFALSNDLKIGVDGKDGTDGKIAVNGKDGSSVVINGADGSIGLTGPAGANGISPTLTMRPDIKPGDVTNNTKSITRITYKDAGGHDATLATLENDGLRFSGNDNPVAGYVTRNLNQEMQIKGGATIAGSYSSANIKTVATQDGGIEIQIADSPKFGDITINNAGKISGVEAGVDGKDAVNVDQLKDYVGKNNGSWNISDGTKSSEVKTGNTVTIAGNNTGTTAGNINVTNDGNGNLTIESNAAVKHDNVTVGGTTINKDTGITVGDTNINNQGDITVGDKVSVKNDGVTVGDVSITVDDGIHAGDKKITGVADGIIAADSKDAVNGGQIHDMQVEINKQAGGWELTDGQGGKQQVKAGDTVAIVGSDNINVEFDAGGKMVVETTPDVTHNKVTTGDTVMNDNGVTIKDGPSITKNGVNAGDKKITSVAKGDINKDSTDAVNGSQLNDTNNRVTVNEGDIANNTTNITKNADDIANNTTNITKNAGDIANNTTNITKNADDIANNTTNITKNAGDIANNTTNITKNAGDIANNTTNITKNAGDIANNAGDIENIQNGKDGMFQVSQDYNAPAPKPTGKKSAAGGAGAVASGDNSTAVGNDAQATESNSTALGNSAWASANNSVALGHGSVADRANSVSVGSAGAERQITNVAAGVAPTDAVNVSQLEALGGTVNQYFNAANKRIDKVDNNARAGIAAAMAAGTLPQSTLPGKSMVTVGVSTYRGESALALGVSRLSDNARTVIKANASADSRGNAGAAVGAGWHW